MTTPLSFDFTPADYHPLYKLMTKLGNGVMLYPSEVIDVTRYSVDHDSTVLDHQSASRNLVGKAARGVGRMAGYTRNAAVSTVRFFGRPETKASFLIGHWAGMTSAIAFIILALNSWVWTITLLAFYLYLTAAIFESIMRLA